MFLSADLANLLFYCAQQLGVTLGVGAETIMLAAYLISMRDGVVDEKETQYARAIKRTMAFGLWLIVISGLGITALHIAAGQSAVIVTPAYLFKWLLVLGAVLLTLLRKKYPTSITEGVIGGTWYAIFLVHILAPVTGWINLGTLYAVWLGGFVLCWEILVIMHKDKKPGGLKLPASVKKEALPEPSKPIAIEAPVPVPPPPPAPKIVLAPDLPKPIPTPPPAPVVVAPPAVPVPPAPAPTPTVPPAKLETIAVAKASPFESIAPSPAGKVTDTPFLPKVAPLQPMTTLGSAAPVAPATPVANAPSPTTVPVTTAPGGTSTPTPPTSQVALVQEGLSAMNVMPKAPPAK